MVNVGIVLLIPEKRINQKILLSLPTVVLKKSNKIIKSLCELEIGYLYECNKCGYLYFMQSY